MIDHARRCVLHLVWSGAVLTAVFGTGIANARPAAVAIRCARNGAAGSIVRLIRQWLTERRHRPSLLGDGAGAPNSTAETTELNSRRAPTRIAFARAPIPTADILRSWAHRKPVEAQING